MPLWLKRIFTTEDTEVHRDAQGKMPLWLKRIFTTEDTEVHRDAQGKMPSMNAGLVP